MLCFKLVNLNKVLRSRLHIVLGKYFRFRLRIFGKMTAHYFERECSHLNVSRGNPLAKVTRFGKPVS